jgi:hypothetical protein
MPKQQKYPKGSFVLWPNGGVFIDPHADDKYVGQRGKQAPLRFPLRPFFAM